LFGKHIKISRTDLYERVWTTPLRTLAKEFGLSDVGLAKLCRRHDIPLPGRGYWVRMQFGKKQERTALPDAIDATAQTIVITAPESRSYEKDLPPRPSSILTVQIPEGDSREHPIASKTAKAFVKARPHDKGMLVPQSGQISAVGLTSDSLSRGLRLLDALLTGAEGQGHSVVFTQNESTHLRFLVGGEEIHFRLSEAYDQKAHTPTKEEVARKKDWNWYQPKKWDYVPSGRLRLSVENLPYGVRSVRRMWSDAKKQRLEDCLGDFILNLGIVAKALKLDREECQRREREREEERRREEEQRVQREEYLRKVEVMKAFNKEWEQSLSLARFAQAFVSALEAPEVPEQTRTAMAPIAAWVGRYASAVNPFTRLERIEQHFLDPKKFYGF